MELNFFDLAIGFVAGVVATVVFIVIAEHMEENDEP